MKHAHRFHVTAVPAVGQPYRLTGDDAHHAAKVLRVRAGEPVALFDGAGQEWEGAVLDVERNAVSVSITALIQQPPPAPALTLALAWLHRDKAIEDLVRRGTELGVNRFVFFRAARSQKPPKFSEKWPRIAVECCKQSGQLWLPAFEVVDDLDEVLSTATGDLLLATLDAAPRPLSAALSGKPITLLVGPEGDFTAEETAAALAAGAAPLSLGETVFRAEVAAEIALTLIRYETGALGPRK